MRVARKTIPGGSDLGNRILTELRTIRHIRNARGRSCRMHRDARTAFRSAPGSGTGEGGDTIARGSGDVDDYFQFAGLGGGVEEFWAVAQAHSFADEAEDFVFESAEHGDGGFQGAAGGTDEFHFVVYEEGQINFFGLG